MLQNNPETAGGRMGVAGNETRLAMNVESGWQIPGVIFLLPYIFEFPLKTLLKIKMVYSDFFISVLNYY